MVIAATVATAQQQQTQAASASRISNQQEQEQAAKATSKSNQQEKLATASSKELAAALAHINRTRQIERG
ncbi:hypothetical protein VC279_19375 [Xanthomonas sp. WHRI 10064A]|uniref:hypothetical protein n=1 Tax=unclassified Xanthomonas TaxID=2643310 RepID=UPI002B23B003|nr:MULTISPECIES: hypothetical protein [unclassified Xanthomonas]MEA9589294.1 hypothetical protein [Xanthomonas sp. WHRI 10064B]MEA9616783.1 hypothetical protein [Xanthomonas sp. WHRI 10064A]